MLERGRQFVGTLAGRLALLHEVLYVLAHLAAPLGLLLPALLHRLPEFGDVLLQRSHDLAEAQVAGL